MITNSTELTIRSHAKVNLTLDILGLRDDGYHSLRSVMQSIGVYDTITLRRSSPGIHLTCSDVRIPINERNLAYKAAEALYEAAGIEPAIDIHLEKKIPSQAGMGGGSSNAASVLRALNLMLGEPLNLSALCEVGANIGSDVPFFLIGGTALVQGRGEDIEALPSISTQWMLIIKPPFGISTPWAYRRLDEIRAQEPEALPKRIQSIECNETVCTSSDRMIECIEAKDWDLIPKLLSNDLEAPSIERYPDIEGIKEALTASSAKGALMCGSGSAVFGIFANEQEAQSAAEKIGNRYGRLFVTRTINRRESWGIDRLEHQGI
ncbi:MAG: 4-(cytidine 5'-diphospho)-2-C-methyl-D-erythritol kinase [Armatimonadota bacterium]